MRTNPTHSQREEFVALMVKHANATNWYCQRIMRYGATYGRLQEAACNRELTAAELAKEARVEEALKKLAKELDCTVVFSGDPRGNTVKIKPADGFTNDWGREGICVPTS